MQMLPRSASKFVPREDRHVVVEWKGNACMVADTVQIKTSLDDDDRMNDQCAAAFNSALSLELDQLALE